MHVLGTSGMGHMGGRAHALPVYSPDQLSDVYFSNVSRVI